MSSPNSDSDSISDSASDSISDTDSDSNISNGIIGRSHVMSSDGGIDGDYSSD